MSKKFGCDQCEPMMINGTFCHEIGCPNSKKIWDEEEGWVWPPREDDPDDLGDPLDWDDEDEDDDDYDDWIDRMEDLGPTGHGDICYSDADPGL